MSCLANGGDRALLIVGVIGYVADDRSAVHHAGEESSEVVFGGATCYSGPLTRRIGV